MYNCLKCGCCCRNLKASELYEDLDRGDGICVHFDINTAVCLIYESRPLKCRVDEFYKINLSDKMSISEYYEANYECCEMLRKKLNVK